MRLGRRLQHQQLFFRPIRIQVIERSPDTDGLTHLLRKRYMGFKNQRTAADFRNPAIRTERALTRDPGYKPQFVNYPLQIEELDIDLDDEDMRQVKRLIARGLADDAEDAVRSGAMTWYTKNRTLQISRKHWISISPIFARRDGRSTIHLTHRAPNRAPPSSRKRLADESTCWS